MAIYDKFLLTASKDGSFRVWTSEGGTTFTNAFIGTAPCGPVNCIRTIGTTPEDTKIWLGGERGISCINMKTLQCEGSFDTGSPVVGPFFLYGSEGQEYIIAALKNGTVKCYNFQGQEVHSTPEGKGRDDEIHCSEMMEGPQGKVMILCGHDMGWVTVYELPSFQPVGTFC